MQTQDHAVRFNVSGVAIDAEASIPADATGVVLFVHGSGSHRLDLRGQRRRNLAPAS